MLSSSGCNTIADQGCWVDALAQIYTSRDSPEGCQPALPHQLRSCVGCVRNDTLVCRNTCLSPDTAAVFLQGRRKDMSGICLVRICGCERKRCADPPLSTRASTPECLNASVVLMWHMPTNCPPITLELGIRCGNEVLSRCADLGVTCCLHSSKKKKNT